MKVSQNTTDTITLPSDFYYEDLTGNWLKNEYDFQPELFVGRIIAKKPEQITNYTDKLYRYEINPGKGNHSYLKRALYSQGYDLIMSMEVYNIRKQLDKIYNNPEILSESTNIEDTSKYPSGELIIDTINVKNYGFISLHHHGFPGGLITYGYRNTYAKDYFRFLWAVDTIHTFVGIPERANDDPSSKNGLNNLINKWYPSICYSTGCTTMPFDTIPGYENIPMNFGESFTTGKDYGGPAFIGNTRDGYTPNTSYLERSFANKINEKYYQIGVANALARTATVSLYGDTVANKYTCINQNLLGDPEFEVWTDLPLSFSNIVIQRTNNGISISGIDVDSTTVAFCSTNNVKLQKLVRNPDINLNNASPNSPIVLYKHNYIPFIAPLLLQNESFSKSEYIIANDVVVGNSIDTNRSSGDVVITEGIEYEIEASGTVRLEDGFKVEKGATFTVYPACY